MTNRHIITDEERGRKPKLSPREKTVRITLWMPESLKKRALLVSNDTLRKILDINLPELDQKQQMEKNFKIIINPLD